MTSRDSQAGAQFGFTLTWTIFLTLPCMEAIQVISACMGWETREGLARNVALRLPTFVVFVLVGLLVVANTMNIASAVAQSAGLARSELMSLAVGLLL